MNDVRFDGNVGEALNTYARHQMLLRLFADIRADLAVCEIEGWDKTEYLRMLKSEIDYFFEGVTDGALDRYK